MNTEIKFKVTNISDSPRKVRINGRNILLQKGDSYKTDYPPEDGDIWKVLKTTITKEKIPVKITE